MGSTGKRGDVHLRLERGKVPNVLMVDQVEQLQRQRLIGTTTLIDDLLVIQSRVKLELIA